MNKTACRACLRPATRSSHLCARCRSRASVKLSDDEIWLCERLPRIFQRAIPVAQLPAYMDASNTLVRGKQPSPDQRILVAQMAWALGLTFDRCGWQDRTVESLFRKLIGRDRRTDTPAPFPPLQLLA